MVSKWLTATALTAVLTMSFATHGIAEDSAQYATGPSGGAVAAAVVSDIFYVPGKAGACLLSGVLWTATMALTAGTYYNEAGSLVHGACTGKWVITGEDIEGSEKE